MKKGYIVTVVAISGEYVGTFDSQLDTSITLSEPKMIVSNPEGGMGFARGVAVTGHEAPADITFNNYVFVTPSNEGVADAYAIATGAKEAPRVQAPAEKKIIV